MNDPAEIFEEVLDLGKATVETKGAGILDVDNSGDKLVFTAGIADD